MDFTDGVEAQGTSHIPDSPHTSPASALPAEQAASGIISTPSTTDPDAPPPSDLVLPDRAGRLSPYAALSDVQLDAIHIAALVDAVLNTRDEEVRLKAIHDLGEYRGKYAEATAKAQSKYGPKQVSGPTINALIADERISKRLSEGLLKCLGTCDASSESSSKELSE